MRRWIGIGAALGALSGCGEDPPPAVCAADASCGGDEVCQAGACVHPARLDCVPGGDAAPRARVTPETVDFGLASVGAVARTVTIENAGGCTLELFSAALEGGPPFRCAGCTPGRFPQDVLPGRSLDIEVELTPGAPGLPADALLLRTNDPRQVELRVPLRGIAAGTPAPAVTPSQLDFGFVPEGRSKTRVVQVLNAAEGSAPLQIREVRIEPAGTAFSVTPSARLPASLVPAREDPSARLALDVAFAPAARAAHAARLVVIPADTDPVEVALVGAERPPVLGLSTSRLDFGAVRLGTERRLEVAVQNSGPSPLEVQVRLSSGQNADLTLVDDLSAPLPAGALRSAVVRFAPTAPGPITDALVLESNDPSAATRTVPITGRSDAEAVEVVTVSLEYENGQDTPLDVDLRDVDLLLESPGGQVCREADPMTAWGPGGRCRWSSSGANENPERIVLADVTADGRYPVLLSYVEDCASLPTALTATILGIGTDELVDALAEEDVMLPPGELEAAIQQACVQRRSAPGTLTVKAGGRVLAQQPVRPTTKGDMLTPLVLVRGPGGFTVE